MSHPNDRYRINYGNGQVSERMNFFAAIREWNRLRQDDPYGAFAFIQYRDLGSADCPGEWITVKP